MIQVPEPIKALLTRDGTGQSVVFDADGTLWRGDVGEDFLRHLSANNLVPSVGGQSAWARYETINHADPTASYGFAVSVMAGMAESELLAMSAKFFADRFAGRVFAFVRPLLKHLREHNFDVWVCSASPRWVVEPGAASLGIAADRVLGVSSEVENGRLTSTLIAPVCAGPGKVTWLERKGVKPLLAVGNGDLDLNMLAYAQNAWVIAPPDGHQSAIVREAKERKWPISRV